MSVGDGTNTSGGASVVHLSSNLVTLAPGKTDAELATELRASLRPLLEEVVSHLNTAARAGLQVNFQIGRDAYGRSALVSLDVVRPL